MIVTKVQIDKVRSVRKEVRRGEQMALLKLKKRRDKWKLIAKKRAV